MAAQEGLRRKRSRTISANACWRPSTLAAKHEPLHKRVEARRAIESVGTQLVLLPPYSPDLNPIEMAFSKIKAELRRRELRTIADVEDAFGECPDWFTRRHCRNFLKHCGYTLQGS